MELEINEPKFKMPELRGIRNPLTHQGVRALEIVLVVIVVISGIVYAANFRKRRKSTVLPAKTGEEVTVTSQPTIPTETPTITPLTIPLTEEETSSASPSPTRKVQKPTETLTPAVEGVTVTPAPTI